MSKYLIAMFLLAFVVPSVALASWWNPLSWFNYWGFRSENEGKPQILEQTTDSEVNIVNNIQSVTSIETVSPQKVQNNLSLIDLSNTIIDELSKQIIEVENIKKVDSSVNSKSIIDMINTYKMTVRTALENYKTGKWNYDESKELMNTVLVSSKNDMEIFRKLYNSKSIVNNTKNITLDVSIEEELWLENKLAELIKEEQEERESFENSYDQVKNDTSDLWNELNSLKQDYDSSCNTGGFVIGAENELCKSKALKIQSLSNQISAIQNNYAESQGFTIKKKNFTTPMLRHYEFYSDGYGGGTLRNSADVTESYNISCKLGKCDIFSN